MVYNYTIIIPHFTKDGNISLLTRALDSIPIRDDIQIIVVDNSTIPIQGLNKNITLLYSDNKSGAGGARNIGIQNALGNWLLFLDADDFFVKDAFVVLDKYLFSKFDIIYFKPISINEAQNTISNRHCTYAKMVDDFFVTGCTENLRLNHCIPWSKMIKKTLIIDNNIFFDEVPASNDVIFSLKTGICANKIHVDKGTIYCVTDNNGSITKTESLRNLESRFHVAIRKNNIMREYGYKADVSLLYYVIKSYRYGIKTFILFMHQAISSGYFFVGWRRWWKTFVSIK